MPYKDPAQQLAYQNAWMQRRRQEWIEENGPCVDCGSQEDLTVDHKDASEKITHRVWSWSQPRRDEELAKCVVRCESCHKVKTRLNRETGGGQSSASIEVAREIRRLYARGGVRQTDLARQFRISQRAVSDIITNRRWVEF
jgi:hypothetical protein